MVIYYIILQVYSLNSAYIALDSLGIPVKNGYLHLSVQDLEFSPRAEHVTNVSETFQVMLVAHIID